MGFRLEEVQRTPTEKVYMVYHEEVSGPWWRRIRKTTTYGPYAHKRDAVDAITKMARYPHVVTTHWYRDDGKEYNDW